MIENKYFDGGDMELPIPVTSIDRNTGKVTRTIPRTDFTQATFDVLINEKKIEGFSWPTAFDGRTLAKNDPDSDHIFILPMLAETHFEIYGNIEILTILSAVDSSYTNDKRIPALVKGGRKCQI